jgi:hypothetical protein
MKQTVEVGDEKLKIKVELKTDIEHYNKEHLIIVTKKHYNMLKDEI